MKSDSLKCNNNVGKGNKVRLVPHLEVKISNLRVNSMVNLNSWSLAETREKRQTEDKV